MVSTPRKLKKLAAKKSATSSSHYRKSKPTITRTSSVSDKLEALKNLIPTQQLDAAGADADKLFKETADYILLLRTQVSILQKLVDFYGNSSSSSLVQQFNTRASIMKGCWRRLIEEDEAKCTRAIVGVGSVGVEPDFMYKDPRLLPRATTTPEAFKSK